MMRRLAFVEERRDLVGVIGVILRLLLLGRRCYGLRFRLLLFLLQSFRDRIGGVRLLLNRLLLFLWLGLGDLLRRIGLFLNRFFDDLGLRRRRRFSRHRSLL